MRLSTRSLYGMRALIELALAEGRGPVSAAHIAKQQALSAAYLEQLLHRLRRHGLISSVRGPRGGYLLAKSPRQVTMAQVVQVLDGTNVRWAAGCRAAVRLGLGNGPARRNVVRLARTPAQPLGGASRQTQWIAEAVWRCVHERLTHSLDGVTLQDLCDEVRAIAGEPLEHRYVFHI